MRLLVFILVFSNFSLAWAYQPFFDHDKKTRYAPEPPKLTSFDKDILKLCGGWGAHVDAKDFEALLNQAKHSQVVKIMQTQLAGKIFGKKSNKKQFIHELRRIWFEQKGFQHVFCGEPGIGKDLGGLHYAARYWQAQQKGWAGYRKLNPIIHKRTAKQCQLRFLKESTKHPIYSVSIAFNNKKYPKQNVKCLSGYHYDMTAMDILIAGAKAFKIANRKVGKNSKEACLFETKQGKIPKYFNMLVIKRRAIRTFYPIAEKRPYCKKNKKNYKACFCSNL